MSRQDASSGNRNSQRGNGQGGRGHGRGQPINPTAQGKGLIDSLPFLNVKAGSGASGEQVQRWITAMKMYSMANFVSGLDRIFDRPEGEYPEFREPERPAAGDDDATLDPLDVEIWREDFKAYRKNILLLEEHKVKLLGVLLGQMSQSSKDMALKDNRGVEAMDERDPLKLVQAIVSTHLVSSNTDPMLNYYEAETNFRERLRMGDGERIENFYRRVEASVDSLTESAARAGHDDKVPDQETLALHFIDRLSSAYGEYRHCVIKGILTRPGTLEEAYRAAVNFGTSRVTHFGTGTQRDHRGVFAAYTPGRGDKGTGTGRRKPGSGPAPKGKSPRLTRDQCAICYQTGHWKRDCPMKDKDEDHAIEQAIAESRPIKAAGGGGKKVKKN